MAKKFALEMAYPMKEFLSEFGRKVWNNEEGVPSKMVRGAADVAQLTKDLAEGVNWGACLNDGQADLIKRHLLYVRGESIDIKTALLPVVMDARHECENCLNIDCVKRDPAHNMEHLRWKVDPMNTPVRDFPSIGIGTGNWMRGLKLGDVAQMTAAQVLRRCNNDSHFFKEVQALMEGYDLRFKEEEEALIDTHSQKTHDEADDAEHSA